MSTHGKLLIVDDELSVRDSLGKWFREEGYEVATVENAAKAAGMNVHTLVSPGTGHDWYTEQYGVTQSLPYLASLWGLTP